MQAEVEVYGPGQDSPRYAVKAEDMPRLRAERITTPGGTGISHTGSLYALPDAGLRRELIGIIERALPPKK